jgi:hypothetical protein
MEQQNFFHVAEFLMIECKSLLQKYVFEPQLSKVLNFTWDKINKNQFLNSSSLKLTGDQQNVFAQEPLKNWDLSLLVTVILFSPLKVKSKELNELLKLRNVVYGHASKFTMTKKETNDQFKKIIQLMKDIGVPKKDLEDSETRIRKKNYSEMEILNEKVKIQQEMLEKYEKLAGNIQILLESNEQETFKKQMYATAAGIQFTFIFSGNFENFQIECYKLMNILNFHLCMPPSLKEYYQKDEVPKKDIVKTTYDFLKVAFACLSLETFFDYPLKLVNETLEEIKSPFQYFEVTTSKSRIENLGELFDFISDHINIGSNPFLKKEK